MKKKNTASSISIILIADRQMWYVCVGLQLLSSKPTILPNIKLIKYMYMISFMGKMRKMYFHSPVSTTLITERQIWYVCVGRQLLSIIIYPISQKSMIITE